MPVTEAEPADSKLPRVTVMARSRSLFNMGARTFQTGARARSRSRSASVGLRSGSASRPNGTPFAGLRNEGATCYLNAVMQVGIDPNPQRLKRSDAAVK